MERQSLSHITDAVTGDLYLLRDAEALDRDPALQAELKAQDIAPVLSTTGGLFVALPPHEKY